MTPFLERIRSRPLLFDGATGTELYQRGVFLNRSFDELNLSQPSLVLAVHRDYLAAGAMVLTANTYGANRVRLARHGLEDRVVDVCREGVLLAQRADEDAEYYVAGAVGPSGAGALAHVPEGQRIVLDAYREQIEALVAAGADMIALETFVHLPELELALQAAREYGGGLPIVAQMRFTPDLRLEDGTEPEAVAARLVELGADVIGANCGEGPQSVFEVARRMLDAGVPVMAQPNAGRPEEFDGRTIYVTGPEYFGVYARRLLKVGVRGVGGCCGTRPEHIKQMAGAVRMMSGGMIEGGVSSGGLDAIETREPMPVGERSGLGAKFAAGEFVVSVEVNPPTSLDPAKQLAAARKLIAGGATVINTSDGPRASARMANVTMAEIFQRDVGCEVILHVCCRDRNLLGLVAHLLGAQVAGVRNLVIITGDPPKLGDYPHATAVYDVDSVGLLRIAEGMNRGIDPGGKRMKHPTSFLKGTGVEPAALDYERELARLQQKKEAGADFVMTQPVYDVRTLERFLDDTKDLGLPVMVGLLPLASHKNAEFLHHEVPGMRIPGDVRDRMRAVGSGPEARAEGVRIASEMLAAVRSRVAGAYIMPPLGRYDMALAMLEQLD